MKDEIKEWLDYFKKYATISEKAILEDIEDYITNLQEENKRLKVELELYKDNHIYLNDKIDKAIEYINNLRDESAERQGFYNCFPDDLYIADIEELLEILKGSDE